MKTRTSLWVLLLALLILLISLQPGCKKDKPQPEPELEPDVIIAETTKVITDEDWNNNIISIDSTDFTLTFDAGINAKSTLEVGDVIISSVGYGLMRKVTMITADGQQIVVSTEQASLADAFIKGSFKYKVDVSDPRKIKKVLRKADGVRILSPDDKSESGLVLEISEDFGTDYFSIAGVLEIGQFEFEGGYDWHWKEAFIDYPVLDSAYGSFSVTETFTLTEDLSYSVEFKKSVELITLEYPKITVLIGGAPVIITPQVIFTAGVEIEAGCSLSAGLTQELIATGGAYYNGQWNPYFGLEKDFGVIPPSLSNSLSAKVYVEPKLVMVIDLIFKPNVSVQPYGLLEAEIGSTPWWYFYLGVKSDLGMAVDLVFFNLIDYKATLFDKQFEIANSGDELNNPPEADFTVEPYSGNIGTNFHFDASGCTDEEDDTEDLQVRWDWENDGVWDTEYQHAKEIDHVFDQSAYHTVKLEVKDTEGATDNTTNQVYIDSSHNPEAAFTVTPTTGTTDTVFHFDASVSSDEEDPVEDIQVRWDWDGDGMFDTQFSTEKQQDYQYTNVGTFNVILEVKDTDLDKDQVTHQVVVDNSSSGTPCPGFETVEYGGQIYNTVLIGNKCWFKENLNIGTRIDGSFNQEDNQVIEKYCYDDDVANCDVYGGLYLWNEMMQYVDTEGAQGICPIGWHIPSDEEWKTLEGTVDSQFGVGDPEWDKTQWRGFDVGNRLKSVGYWHYNEGIDTHGFRALPGGYRSPGTGDFNGIEYWGYFWSSSICADSVCGTYRYLLTNKNKVYRHTDSFWMGFSVRCVKD